MSQRYLAFENKRKEKDNQPDYRIFINPGEDGELSRYSIGGIWIREGKKGQYLSITIEDEEYKPESRSDRSEDRPTRKSLSSKLKSHRVKEDDSGVKEESVIDNDELDEDDERPDPKDIPF